MAISFTTNPLSADKATSSTPTKPKKCGGHVKAKPPTIDLNGPGLLSVANCMALAGVGSPVTISTWIEAGKFPPADLKLGRSPKWRTATIRAWLAGEWTPQ